MKARCGHLHHFTRIEVFVFFSAFGPGIATVLLLPFHFDEHAVHFFHFSDAILVFLQILCFVGSTVLLSTRWFLHKASWVTPRLSNALNCRWINVVAKRRRVQLFQTISNFFLLSKLEEVFKSGPLLILFIDQLPLLFLVLRWF